MENINKYQYCDLINLTSDAYSSILNHALLTENEEIMGLLIGNEIKKKRFFNNKYFFNNMFNSKM